MRSLAPLLALVPFVAGAQTAGVLPPAEIEQLESTLAQNPDDRAAQTVLGRNYAFAILGITAVGPADRVTAIDPARAASPLSQHARDVLQSSAVAGLLAESGKALWNLATQAQSYALLTLRNGNANYGAERALAAAALDRAIALDPRSPGWRSYRIPVTMFRSNFNAVLHLAPADAFALVKDDFAVLTGLARNYALADVAKLAVRASALDDAEAYGRELIGCEFRDWNYGNALYFGNMVLGQVALRRGDVPGAIARLRESGKTPGSPQLNSFGPNMTLARELIVTANAGARQAVLQFFDLCAGFWKSDHGRLEQWAKVVRSGGIPEFGANLLY